MLTNNQFKYIGYGIMIFIILILISNIYITKINNNYTASGLIEGFSIGGSRSEKDTTKLGEYLPQIIAFICNKDNKDKIISYAKSFGNDVPKLKGIIVMQMMKDIEAMYTGGDKRSSTDIMKDITTSKNLIDALDTIGDNVKYLEQDCGGGLFSGLGGSIGSKNGSSWFGGSSSSNNKSSSGGWFSGGGTNNNKSSGGGWFSSGGSNNKSSNQGSSNSGSGWFSSGGSNNNKSSSGGWFGGDDSD